MPGMFHTDLGYKPRYTHEDKSALGRILDFIQRPSYFGMNVLEAFQDEVTNDKDRRTAGEIFAPINPFYRSGEGLWKLPEEVKGRGKELFEDVEDMPGWMKEIAGLAVEIGADPTTYMGIGAITRGGKAALKSGVALSKMSKSVQAEKGLRALLTFAGQPLVKGAPVFRGMEKVAGSPLLEPLAKLFRVGSKIPGVQEAYEISRGKGAIQEGLRKGGVRGFKGVAKAALKGGPLTKADLSEMIELGGKVVDQPGLFGKGKSLADDALDVYRQGRKYWEELEHRIGLLDYRLADEDTGGVALEYLLHRMTKKGGKAWGEIKHKLEYGFELTDPEKKLYQAFTGKAVPISQKGEFTPILSPMHDALFARSIRGKSAKQLNKLAKDLGFGKMWVDDPVELMARRWQYATRSYQKREYLRLVAEKMRKIGKAHSLKDVLKAAGGDMEKVRKNFLVLGDDVLQAFRKDAKIYKYLSNIVFEKGVGDEMLRVMRAYVSPESVRGWLKLYDKGMGVLKWWTLGPFVPYHVRNAFSDDVWFYGLANGFDNMEPFGVAAHAIKRHAIKNNAYGSGAVAKKITQFHPQGILGKIKGFFTGKSAAWLDPLKMDEEIELMVKHGVLGTGWVASEVPGFSPFMDTVTAVGTSREDLSRAAHWFARRMSGWNPGESAADVIKYHYNYSRDALSPWEREVPARLLFFYRWLRFNTPGSIRNLFEHWGKHTTIAKSLRTIEESAEGIEGSLVPEWMKARGPVRVPSWLPLVGGKDDKAGMFLTQAWWPFAEIAELSRPGEAFLERLAPPVRMMMEAPLNREFYYDRPIVAYPGQKKELLAKNFMLPAWLAYALRQWRGVSEWERGRRRFWEAETPMDKIEELLRTGAFGARSYSFDPAREAKRKAFDFRDMAIAVRRDLSAAERRGRPEQVERLQQLLRELEKKQADLRVMSERF